MGELNRIEVRMQGANVGMAALTADGLLAFEYDADWLRHGFSISPLELPLEPGVRIAPALPFDGNFGVFDDALPDGWGMLILDRYLQSKGISLRSLSLLDRLAYVGTTGRGALEFFPDLSAESEMGKADFLRIEHEISQLLSTENYDGEGLENLWRRGGSPGGARPKVFVRVDEAEWLVKFPARYDAPTIGQEEYAYSQLAKQCGIDMPETRLFEGRFFATKRFDRGVSGERFHTLSAAGLLQVDYRTPCIDYVHLMALTRQLTNSEAQLWKVYRVMAFNYLIGNKDDHAKNFSFIYQSGAWQYAPAYDLLPSEGMNGYHTTSFADSITPTDSDVVKVAGISGLPTKKAEQVLEEMRETVQSNPELTPKHRR